MDWLVFGVQWLHILLGILWFGNALVIAFIIIPVISRLPITTQREFGSHLGARADRLFLVVGPAVIILGIIRGTIFGPIKSADVLFGSAYGITWLVALIAAILTFLWGKYMIGGAVKAMDAVPLGPDGTGGPALVAATDRVKLIATLELIGFVVVFTCMILMRFGL